MTNILWLIDKLKKVITEASETGIFRMIGLELGLSLCKLKSIRRTTSRKILSKLRANSGFYGERNRNETINSSMVLEDLVYFVRLILHEVNARSTSITVAIVALECLR